jgi:Flp pilus assembly protein TadG
MSRSTYSPLRREDGQALVEFALVLPVLVLILFGMIQFGKAFNYWNDATHLTAEAARFAAVNRKPDPSSAASLQAQIRAQIDTNELKNGGTDSVSSPATVCVEFPNGTSNVGDPVRVKMTFSYTWMPLLNLVPGTKDITSTTVMRLEARPTTYSAGCA